MGETQQDAIDDVSLANDLGLILQTAGKEAAEVAVVHAVAYHHTAVVLALDIADIAKHTPVPRAIPPD